MKIFVVEDDLDISSLLQFNLTRAGYEVSCIGSGEEAWNRLQNDAPDMLILDFMLPGLNGVELCRKVKNDPNFKHIFVLILSAKAEDADIVYGFEVGADDYVLKPFRLVELMARIRSHFKRCQEKTTFYGGLKRRIESHFEKPKEEKTPEVLQEEDLHLNCHTLQATLEGNHLDLTPKEFTILKRLILKMGRAFKRHELIDPNTEDSNDRGERSVDVHIVSLRRKLGSFGNKIETVRGVGYRFNRSASDKGQPTSSTALSLATT